MTFHHVPCNECYYCRKGTPAQCPLYKKTGVTAGFEPSGGGFAEYIRVMDFVVANRGVVRIPDGVPFEQAAFVEPVNTVLKGVKLLNLAPDDTVLVIGQGPIGLMHAVLSSRIGAQGADFGSLPRAPCNSSQIRTAASNTCRERERARAGVCRNRRPWRGRRDFGRGRHSVGSHRNGCSPARRQSDVVCPDSAWRSQHRSRRGMRRREDAAWVLLLLVSHSRRSNRPGLRRLSQWI